MRNSLKAFIVVLGILTGAAIAVAAPQTSYERNLLPEANDTYDLGSTTPAYEWNSLYSRQVCISGDCKTAWPVGGGSGSPGGSAGSIQINQAGNFGGISTSTLLKSVATSTSVLYINGNRTDTYTADGTYFYPYKTLTAAAAAITAAGLTSVAVHLAPGTYAEPSLIWPNVPTVMYGNGASIVMMNASFALGAGTFTVPGDFSFYDFNIFGGFAATNPSTSNPHFLTNCLIVGTSTFAGNATLNNCATLDQNTAVFPFLSQNASSTMTFQPGSLGNIVGSNIQSNIVNKGVLNLNDVQVIGATSSAYLIDSSTAGSELLVNGATFINRGTGGGINCSNTATAAAPNAMTNFTVTVGVGTPTNNALNCGNAFSYVNIYSASDLAGRQYIASGPGLRAQIQTGLTVEGTSTLNAIPGTLTGLSSTTPFADLSIHANNGELTKYLFAIGSSTQTSTSTLLLVDNVGNLYLATSSPMNVSGVALGNGAYYAPQTGYLFANSTNTGMTEAAVGDLRLTQNGSTVLRGAGAQLQLAKTTIGAIGVVSPATGTNLTVWGGNAGMGSTSAMAKLSVHAAGTDTNQYLFAIGSSTQTATTTLFSVSNTGFVNSYGTTATGATSTNEQLRITRPIAGGVSYPQAASFLLGSYAANSAANGYGPSTRLDINLKALANATETADTNVMSLLANNNVGVASTSPFARLSVHAPNGVNNTTLFAIGSSTATATTSLFTVDNVGNVNLAQPLDYPYGGTGTSTRIWQVTQGLGAVVGQSPATFFGVGAGPSSLPVNTNYTTGIGGMALANLTATGNESTCVGAKCLQFLTTGDFNTTMGVGAGEFITTSNFNTLIGADSGRDFAGNNVSNNGLGVSTFYAGAATSSVAIGFLTHAGNSNTLVLSGTPTTGDVIQIIFATTSASGMANWQPVGFPVVVNYTVTAGDTTLPTLTTSLKNAITTAASGVNFAMFQATVAPSLFGSTTIYIWTPGTGTSGWYVHATASTTAGAGTTKIATFDGMYSTNNIAIGEKAMMGEQATTTWNNVAIGSLSMPYITSGNNNVALGYAAGNFLGPDIRNTYVGALSGQNARQYAQLGNNTCLGYGSCQNMSTGQQNTVLGAKAANGFSSLSTGTNNIEIGYNMAVPSPTASNQLNIQNMIYGTNNSGNYYTLSKGQIGLSTSSPFAEFGIHAQNTATNRTLFAIGSSTQTATSSLFLVDNVGHTYKGGTTPTLSAGSFFGIANDNVGTILTDTTAATTFTLTFANPWYTAPACTANFATTTSAIAVDTTTTSAVFTFPSVTNVKLHYHCSDGI